MAASGGFRALARMDRAASFGACLGVEGLGQIKQQFPRHLYIHLREKFLPFGLLFRRSLLVITKTQLVAACPDLRSEPNSPVGFAALPDSLL